MGGRSLHGLLEKSLKVQECPEDWETPLNGRATIPADVAGVTCDGLMPCKLHATKVPTPSHLHDHHCEPFDSDEEGKW